MMFNKATNVIEFRLLCTTSAAGGVIGSSGSIVKSLEKVTSAKIQLDAVVSSSSKDRLVHIIASTTVNRKLHLSNNDEVPVMVSPAQLALVKVFDRMVEVQPPKKLGGVVTCRLLVGPGLVGAVMGKEGKRVNKVIKETGGYIKVFGSSELLPSCAHSSDELIQISGDVLAVKKALVAVSSYIQQKASQIAEVADGAPPVLRLNKNMETGDAAFDDRAEGGVVAEVVYKLLCPCDMAGAVLGFRGRKVKALEEETGASVMFSAAEDSYNERVITVSAFEDRKPDHSFAQDALVRVFNLLISSGEKENVSARLLIQPSQFGSIEVLRKTISCVPKATGAKLHILENFAHAGVSSDEKVIQIDGEYPTVQIALFQVSWMLRERVFYAILAKNSSLLLPHNLLNVLPYPNEMAALTDKLSDCGVTEEVIGTLPSTVSLSEFSSGHCTSTNMEHPRGSTSVEGGPELGSSNTSVIVTNTKIEIAVRADVFSSVFCDKGSNLSRLRSISGAEVEVQDLSPGSDGKIVISGTPDQTSAAQSLLQAFIMAAR